MARYKHIDTQPAFPCRRSATATASGQLRTRTQSPHRSRTGFIQLRCPVQQRSNRRCWRLAFQYWGKGFASEAAKGALRVAFQSLALPEVVAFTTIHNRRSRAVMERLGMQESGIFEHPQVPESNALRLHCLYRISCDSNAARRDFTHWQLSTPDT